MAVCDVEPLLAQMKDAVSEQKAAAMLGLPVSALESLADRGLIKRLESAVRGLVPGYAGYHKSSVKRLIDNIWRCARPKRGKAHSIMVAARSISKGETPWAAVISAVVSGDSAVCHNGAHSRSIRFGLMVEDRSSFVAGVRKHLHLAQAKGLPEFIGRSTTAEILQITEASVSRLVKAGPDLFPLRGAGQTPYSSSEMQDLAVRIIFVPEFARRGKLHPRRAVSWLRAKGTLPIASVNGNRDFGYQRSVVEPLLVQLGEETETLKLRLHETAGTVRSALIAAVAAGVSIRDAAQRASVPYREAQRWVTVWREHGAVAPRGGGQRSKLNDHENFLRRIVDEQPGIKLVRICEALNRRGVKTNRSSVRNALGRFGIELASDAARPAGAVELLVGVTGETAQAKAALTGAGDTGRTRLIAAVATGAGIKATAEAMGVPYRKAKRWIEVWRKTGAVAPRGFGKASKLDAYEDFLRQLVGEQPNTKLAEIHEALVERGVKTSKTSVWNALTRFGIELATHGRPAHRRRPDAPRDPISEERNSR
jgi:transposase